MKVKESSLMIMLLLTLGATMLIWGFEMFYIAFQIFGFAVLSLGIIDLCDRQWIPGAIKAGVGLAIVLVFMLQFVDYLLYIVGALLIAYGIFQLIVALKGGKKKAADLIMAILVPALCIVAGVLLIVAQIAMLEILVTIFAIVLLVAAAFFLIKDHILAK